MKKLLKILSGSSEDKRLSLRVNFSWVFAGTIIDNACKFGLFIIMAKFLDVTSVGMFTFALAISAPIIMFSNLNLRAVEATDVRSEFSFNDYLGLRIITNGLAVAIIAGICLFSHYTIVTVLVMFWVTVAKISEAMSDVIFGLFQKREQMDYIGKSYIIKAIGGLLLLTVAIWLTSKIVIGIMALAFWWIFVLLFYDIRNVTKVSSFVPRFHWKILKRLALLSAPLGAVMGLISLKANIPKYTIETYLGHDALGFFGALSYIVAGFIQVQAALGNAAVPRLARYYIENRKAFIKLLAKLLFVGIVLGLGVLIFAVLFGEYFLTLVYTKEYAARHDIFIWLSGICAVNFVCFALGYAMTAARYFRVQVPLFVIVTCATVIACMILVPAHGLKGAVWAMMCAAGIEMLGSTLVVIHSLIRSDTLAKAEPVVAQKAEIL